MRPIIITGIIVALAAGWVAIIAFVIPGSFVVKTVICFFGALAIGTVVALVLRRRWLKRLKAREEGEQ